MRAGAGRARRFAAVTVKSRGMASPAPRRPVLSGRGR